MDLMDYLAVLRRHWIVIALVTALGAASGYAVARTTEPLYRSTTTTFVSLARGDTVAELVQGTTYTQNLVESFTQLATMPAVLDPVIEDLDLDTTAKALGRTITAVTPLDTMFVEVAATSPDPVRAALVADAVAASLARTVASVTPGDDGTRPVVRMTVVSDAQIPTVPFTPNTRRNVILGGLAGLPLGVLLALATAFLDTRVRGERGLPQRRDGVVLGRIPRGSRRSRREPLSPDAPVAEPYAQIRTSLQYIRAARTLHSFVVASSTAREGASRVALGTAAALAQDGTRVLLIDADLRAPSSTTGLDGSVGLTTVLVGDAMLDSAVQPWGASGVDVLGPGPLPPNPAQLVGSPAMVDLLAAARTRYDLVVIDAPPVLAHPDAAVLTRATDGAVLVVGAGRVRRTQVASAMSALESTGAPCLGIVMNRLARVRDAASPRPAAAHARTTMAPGADPATRPEPSSATAAATETQTEPEPADRTEPENQTEPPTDAPAVPDDSPSRSAGDVDIAEELDAAAEDTDVEDRSRTH